MIQLHYYPSNASMTPHILLEELGVPFELKRVDRKQNAHLSPEYLKLNPNGRIPVLVDGTLVLYETAAICLHLADTHPEAGLAPALGTPDRAHLYKWLMWLTNSLQAEMPLYFYSERYVQPGDEGAAAQVKSGAQARIGRMLQQLDAHLAEHGGPYMRGEDHSLLDPYTFMLGRWTRNFSGPSAPPARDLPHLGPFLRRMLARPAVQRVIRTEELVEPLI